MLYTIYLHISHTVHVILKSTSIFNKMISLYRPLFEKYLIEAMDELYADHAMFLEIRAIIPRVYDLDQTVSDPITVAKIYKKVNDE